MKRRYLWLVLPVALAIVPVAMAGLSAEGEAIDLDRAVVRIELNATDGDAGLHFDWDGEGWSRMRVHAPDGKKILDVDSRRQLRGWGLTEGFFESREPPFGEVPLADFLTMFPEGDYRFDGTTIQGDRLVGTGTLHHDLPTGPELLTPGDDDVLPVEGVVIRWGPGHQPAAVDIVGYEVVVETEAEPLRVFSARNLPASITEILVPEAFLERDTEYKYEVLAIAGNGNQTISERSFATR